MPNRVDVQSTCGLLGEAHSIITDSQSIFYISRLQLLDVAFTSFSKPQKRLEDAHCGFLVYAANVCAGCF